MQKGCGVALNEQTYGQRHTRPFRVAHVTDFVWLRAARAIYKLEREGSPVVALARRLVLAALASENSEVDGAFGTDIDVDGGLHLEVETVYTPVSATMPSEKLRTEKAYTYDPTNGTTSAGDVWRVKQ